MQRLDKFLSSNTIYSRTTTNQIIKQGRVSVNGACVKDREYKVDEKLDIITLDGEQICHNEFVYIMLNKPAGVVSASEDLKQKTVVDLLPECYKRYDLFPCGRLDKDTVGLIILTNDGKNAHRLLSPKNHISKTYEYQCADDLSDDDAEIIEQGIRLKDGFVTKPCKVNKITEKQGTITLTEGKYHEIKRIFGACHNKITFLKRISFGEIKLDISLNYGDFRELTKQEKEYFTNN